MIRLFKGIFLLVFITGLLIAGFVLGWKFYESKTMVRDCLSGSRVWQIRAMLRNYHAEHGAFPPPKYQAKAGGPVHSWRVLLVPCMYDQNLTKRYSRYDFNQEWNSTNNLDALCGIPHFVSFNMETNNEFANYLTIGDGEEWPAEKPLKSFLIKEGKDQFLLIEYPDSKIRWMEPKY